MEWKTSTLSAFLEKILQSTSTEWLNMSKNLDGNLKDIANGTHIKIPMDAGYVNFYRLQNSFEITVWMKLEVQDNQRVALEHSNNTKSEEL